MPVKGSKSVDERKTLCINCLSDTCPFSSKCLDKVYFHFWEKTYSHQVAMAFKYYCQNHYRQVLTLDNVAEKVGLCRRQLQYRIKRETKLTALKCLIKIKLDHALQLRSEHPDWKKNEIALTVNWSRFSFWRSYQQILHPKRTKTSKRKSHCKKTFASLPVTPNFQILLNQPL